MLIRKLKLKYIDMNPAFDKDPWLLKQRETQRDEKEKSKTTSKRGPLIKDRRELLASVESLQERYNKSTVGAGQSSLPRIRPTNIDEVRNSRNGLRNSV